VLAVFLTCMMQSGSSVHLQTSESALTFAVQDSGISIPNNDMPRLFEKFYRGTNREALVERHGGKVWVESESGKGTDFYLQIPLSQSKESHRV
jgi:signal transduction histidine kinase